MEQGFIISSYLGSKKLADSLTFKDSFKSGHFNWDKLFYFHHENIAFDGGNYVGFFRRLKGKIYCTCTSSLNEVIKIKKSSLFFSDSFIFEYPNGETIKLKRKLYSYPIYLRLFYLHDASLLTDRHSNGLNLLRENKFRYVFYYDDQKIAIFFRDNNNMGQKFLYVTIDNFVMNCHEKDKGKFLNYIYGFASYLFVSYVPKRND